MAKRSYAVIGLGAFGVKLALELSLNGHTVFVCDLNPRKIEDIKDKVTRAVVADVSNEETIKELNVSKFDCIFLGMSSVLDKQILALTYLKQEGAKKVIAKAKTDIQESILYRLGANQVIQPEQDVAERLARRLAFDNISDLIEFRGFALAEVKVPASLNGKSLMELNLRKTHQITIFLIRKKNSVIDEPTGPDTILSVGDSLTVFGSQYQIEDLFKEN